LHGCTPDKAAALLQEAGGHLRIALQLAGCSEAEIPTVHADTASAVPYKTEEK